MSSDKSMLVLTSPQLYLESKALVDSYFANSTVMVWEQGDTGGRAFINRELTNENWLTCVSIYNDYIFSLEELSKIPVIVNIHPALPSLRGRGYDVLPLIHEHSFHGATLHVVTQDIDAGPIIDVVVEPIPNGIGYLDFRKRNQTLCLKMLDVFLNLYLKTSHEQLKAELNRLVIKSEHTWKGDFIDSANLKCLLSKFFQSHPQHPLAHQIPDQLMSP
jgi:methionyl-tRNA formyltransferase